MYVPKKPLKEKKSFRTTIDGYYIHDVRKLAKYTFEELFLFVKYNGKNHCYDIFIRDKITDSENPVELDQNVLEKFHRHHPKSLNVIILSSKQADLLMN